MRAMPSPTSMTRPTSWRSTSDSKPASWRLMISLISAALIMSFPRRGATPPFRTSPQGLRERSSRSNVVSLRARQTIAHAVKLSVEAAVEAHAADLGHEAAQQPRVHGLFDHECPALEHPRETGAEARTLGVGQRDGRAQLHAGATVGIVVQRPIRGRDRGEMLGAVARRDEGEEIARERRDPEARGHLRDGAALGARRHPRA